MKKVIDARGLTCPQPVVLTNRAIAQSNELTVIVDNDTAVENVTRFAGAKGFAVEVKKKTDGTYIELRKEGTAKAAPEPESSITCATGSGPAGKTLLFVPSNSLGRGPEELGEKLMGAFFHTLLDVEPKPGTIIFINAGVKLATQGSKALEDLRELSARGIEILSCGTCLGYFELTDKLAVGRVSNMFDIATALMQAGKIVEL